MWVSPPELRSGGLFAGRLHQTGNTIRWLGALTNPVVGTLKIHFQFCFLTLRYRIKEANALYVAAISAVATVSYDNVIEGSLFCATPGKANRHHVQILNLLSSHGL